MVVPKLVFVVVFTMFTSSESYRVNALSRDKVEARGKSKAKVNFKRIGGTSKTGSNSSIFIAATLIGAFAGTLSVTAAAPGVVTAAAGVTTLIANCAPTIGLVVPAVAAGSAAVPPALLIVAPIAIIAALALLGALVALHVSTTAALAALAFCPVSNFDQEPMTALVSSQPYLAFPEDLPEMLDDGLDGGMPECHGLKSTILPNTKCGQNDKECQEHACREKCCEDESCTFYQFSVDHESSDSAEVVCQLGEKHLLVDKNCEKPFFGEMCTSRLPFWPQEGKDHTKCLSGYGAGSGFLVDDQMDCQETAVANGHCYYQYNEEKKTCATCKDFGDKSENTKDKWKVYKDPQCGGKHVMAGVVCTDWQLKKVLLSKVKGVEEIRPASRGCRGNSAPCLKKRCRQECSAADTCTFYQFQEGENKCFLGTAEMLDESHVVEPHYGGFVSTERKCKSGFQCPNNNQCVDDCNRCKGYSQNGPKTSGRGKSKRQWCMRSAVESLCYDDNWETSYRGLPVDGDSTWCSGMEKVTVDIAEPLDARETGEGICRKACCSDPDCAVYQMNEDVAKKAGSDFKARDKVQCWLGLEHAGGKPAFKCTGKTTKKFRNDPKVRGGALSKRGCTDGSVACLTKKMCVDHCRTECMGAPIFNGDSGVCEPANSMEDEKLEFAGNPTHKHAFKDNFQHAMPKIKTKDSNGLYLEPVASKGKYTEMDDIVQIQLNSQNIASERKKDMAEACQSLKDDDDDLLCWFEEGANACKCEFSKVQKCATWFHDSQQMKHVVEDVGMLVFSGDKCSCTSSPDGVGAYYCTFGLHETLPVMSAVKGEAALSLAGTKPVTCIPGACDAKMGTKGQVVVFGTHNCGYSHKKDGDEYYCDRNCNCHKELSENDADAGKALEDDECSAGRTCPQMSACTPLEYGSYGCGYSCTNPVGVFHFCTQDCDCEADED